jgi:hypothetical protein
MGLEATHTQVVIESFSKVQNWGYLNPSCLSGLRRSKLVHTIIFKFSLYIYRRHLHTFFLLQNESHIPNSAWGKSSQLHFTPFYHNSTLQFEKLIAVRLAMILDLPDFHEIWSFLTMLTEFCLQSCESSSHPHTLRLVTSLTLRFI